MATILDGHKARWTLIKTEKQIGPLMPGQGIPDYFIAHPEIGSPIEPEKDLEGGGKMRAFTGGVVRWTAENGAELVTE